jgi:NTP pyrophosphatase (non-canonical NTP hydrolase)
MSYTQEQKYRELVARTAKAGEEIRRSLTSGRVDLWHSATGAAGEASEVLDCIKKHVIYNGPLDLNLLYEELGDLEYYLELMRQSLGVTRDSILKGNFEKLNKRYPEGYTDDAAIARADHG